MWLQRTLDDKDIVMHHGILKLPEGCKQENFRAVPTKFN